MELLEELEKNQVILAIFSKQNYSDSISKLTSLLAKKYGKICYLTLNKPFKSITESLSQQNVDVSKFYFIDAITSEVQTPEPENNCSFVSSPKAFTELSISMSTAIKNQKCDCFLFDSLSTLVAYSEVSSIIKLAHNLMTKTRVIGIKAVFIILKEDATQELLKDLYMFVDKVIDTTIPI